MVSPTHGTDSQPKYRNSDTTKQPKQNNYHISGVFDLVIPHMPLLDPGNHCDGAGAAICRFLFGDPFLIIFGLLLCVAGCGWAAVRRGGGVVIRRVQVSGVVLFSLSVLAPFKTFYREGPAVLRTPVGRERNLLKPILLHTPCCYSVFFPECQMT